MAGRGTIVNIRGASPVDDPSYRYKMPLVYGKIEGRGNGIKTVIPNISDVALSLHRQPGEVNKFFGCELGAQTTYNADTDRAIVNGAHTDAVLQNMMNRYIEIFVLCPVPNCGLPETVYSIKNGCIYHKCAACGSKEMVDMQHKLCTYILAQHKKAKKEEKKGKKDKDEKKDKKKKKEKDMDKDSSDDDKQKKKDKKKKDKKKDKKEKSKDKKEKSNYLEDAAFGAKEDELENDADDDSVGSHVDNAGALLLAVEATREFLSSHPEASAEEIAEVVVNQQHASALKSHDKVHILVQAAITPNFFKNGDIEKYAPAISVVTNESRIIERHLIAALEGICLGKPKNFAVMLKQMYDEDALEEETILEWAGEGRSDYTLDSVDEEARAKLRGEAQPVVVWLQEADSDDDEE